MGRRERIVRIDDLDPTKDRCGLSFKIQEGEDELEAFRNSETLYFPRFMPLAEQSPENNI